MEQITLQELVEVVARKKRQYSDRYFHNPSYMLMPLWVCELLEQNRLSKTYSQYGIFGGLIVRPTTSIVAIDEIEVF